MNNNSLLGLRESIQTGRAELIWAVPFTDPCTFGLRAKGGAIFEQGLVVGYSDTVIPGALRFNNNCLELRKFGNPGEWTKLSSVSVDSFEENAVVTFDANGNLQSGNAILENGDLTGLNLIETTSIVPPTGNALILDNIQWPTGTGVAGDILQFTAPGVLGIAAATPTNDLIFSTSNGAWATDRLLKTDPTVETMVMSGIGVTPADDLTGINDLGASGTVYGMTGSFGTIFGTTGDIDYVTGITGSFNTVSGDTGLFDYVCGVTGKFETLIPPIGSNLQLGNALLEFPNQGGQSGAVMTIDENDVMSFQKSLFLNSVSAGIVESSEVKTNQLNELTVGHGITVDSDMTVLDKDLTVTTHLAAASLTQGTTGSTLPELQTGQDDDGSENCCFVSQEFVSPSTQTIREIKFSGNFSVRAPFIQGSSWYTIQVTVYSGVQVPGGTSFTGSVIARGMSNGELAPNDGSAPLKQFTVSSFTGPRVLTAGMPYNIVWELYPSDYYGIRGSLSGTTPALVSPPIGGIKIFATYPDTNTVTTPWTASNFSTAFDMIFSTEDRSIVFMADAIPTGTADGSGVLGNFVWDDDFIYMKTSVGWKRTALSAF